MSTYGTHSDRGRATGSAIVVPAQVTVTTALPAATRCPTTRARERYHASLSRERVLTAAVDLADREGLPAVVAYHRHILRLMRRGGFSDDQAHHALHTLGSGALGFTQELFQLDEAAGEQVPDLPVEQAEGTPTPCTRTTTALRPPLSKKSRAAYGRPCPGEGPPEHPLELGAGRDRDGLIDQTLRGGADEGDDVGRHTLDPRHRGAPSRCGARRDRLRHGDLLARLNRPSARGISRAGAGSSSCRPHLPTRRGRSPFRAAPTWRPGAPP